MSVWTRAAGLFGFAEERAAATEPADLADAGLTDEQAPLRGVIPSGRAGGRLVSQETALTLSTVFRAVQIHATAVAQLPLRIERGGRLVEDTPAIVARPSLSKSRSRFLEELTSCLYLDGNAFLKLVRSAGEVVDIDVLDPRKVTVHTDSRTNRKTFGYGSRTDWTTSDVVHLKFLSIPGLDRGLGPIQAAQVDLAGAIDARDYGAGWFTESGMPNGILKSDQALTKEQADLYRREWDGLDADGQRIPGANHRTRVMGQGLNYIPLLLKPSDVQFLESQQFNTTQIARLMGVPSSLFLAAVQGGSQTYSNVEQDWIGYVRFSLMNVLREIEEAFTELTPRGQTARFSIDVLLRTDTKTRYEAHNLALSAGWKTDDEVRADEGKPPLTPAQREQIAARKSTPATTQEAPSA